MVIINSTGIMLVKKFRPIIFLNTFLFHTTQHNATIAKTMKKVITGSKKKRRVYMEEPVLPLANSFTKDLFKKHPENPKRLSVLNKLFMLHITDLMTTGEHAMQFAGHGLEINKVKVTPDYKGVNVYWIAKETTNENDIEMLLQNKSGQLRHELSQLHIMGTVPKIKFVKDKEYARYLQVDSKLAVADFGEDYEQTDASIQLKCYFELNKPLDTKLKEKIYSLDVTHGDDVFEEIPPMPQNVLGLNHSEIMDRIKKSVKKAQAAHRRQDDSVENIEHSFNPDPIEFKSAKAQREAFRQFLSERQNLKSMSQKKSKNYKPEWDYLKEESDIQNHQQLEYLKLDYWEEDDYIEEDIDINNSNDEKL